MEKIKIRALILDYGGVISQPQNPENVNYILQYIQQDYDDFMHVYYDLRVGYDNGQLSGEGYWVKVLRHFDLSIRTVSISPVSFKKMLPAGRTSMNRCSSSLLKTRTKFRSWR